MENNTRNASFVQETRRCESYHSITVAIVVYSLVTLVLYALLHRRANKYTKVCYGFLGIPVPVNLIYETKDRWVYAVSFGALALQFLFLIFDGSVLSSAGPVGNIWKGIVLIFVMMGYPLAFFALFASIHGPVIILSHIIGLIYVLLVFVQIVLRCNSCDRAIADGETEGVLRNTLRANLYFNCILTSTCFVIVGAFFLFKIVQTIVYLVLGKQLPSQHTIAHHIGHVKRLLNRPPPSIPSYKVLAIFKAYLYQWDPYFKFSVRIMSVGVLIVVAVIQLTVYSISALITAVYYLDQTIELFLFDGKEADIARTVIGFSYFFSVLIPVISSSTVMIGYATSLATYKRNCQSLWKGDRSFLPVKKKPLARTLLSSIHYFGFQIAMVLWAWLVYTVVLLLIVVALIIFIIGLILYKPVRDWVFERFIFFITSFVTGFIILYAQFFFIKFVFVTKGSNLINNRRLFHLFTFLFLFYYALVGLFKAVRRIITSAALSFFYLSRLDTPLTIKGWEWLDKAYLSYTALLKVDSTHNNPVMNVFVYHLSQVAETKAKLAESNELHSPVVVTIIQKVTVAQYYNHSINMPLDVVGAGVGQHTAGGVFNSRAKKRWCLAYTLVRNPDLLILRRTGKHDNGDVKQNPSQIEENGIANLAFLEVDTTSKDDETKL